MAARRSCGPPPPARAVDLAGVVAAVVVVVAAGTAARVRRAGARDTVRRQRRLAPRRGRRPRRRAAPAASRGHPPARRCAAASVPVAAVVAGLPLGQSFMGPVCRVRLPGPYRVSENRARAVAELMQSDGPYCDVAPAYRWARMTDQAPAPGRRLRYPGQADLGLPHHPQPHHDRTTTPTSSGTVHGGVIMKLVDDAAGAVAGRHSGGPAVTASMDEMAFLEPVRVGDLVHVKAQVNWTGRSSMEVGVRVLAERWNESTPGPAGRLRLPRLRRRRRRWQAPPGAAGDPRDRAGQAPLPGGADPPYAPAGPAAGDHGAAGEAAAEGLDD